MGAEAREDGPSIPQEVASREALGLEKERVKSHFKEEDLGEFSQGDHSPIVPGGGLQGHETLKRHTIDRHVGKSVESLKERLKQYSDLPAASSFYDRGIAEQVISEALDKRKLQIDAWLKNPKKPFYEIDDQCQIPVGNYIEKGSDIVEDVSTFRVVLEIDKKSSLGYGIKTAYPRKP